MQNNPQVKPDPILGLEKAEQNSLPDEDKGILTDEDVENYEH